MQLEQLEGGALARVALARSTVLMAGVSSVWLHFLKVESEQKAVCLHCKKQYKYEKGGTTSALLRHLNKKHLTKIKREEATVKTEAQHLTTGVKQEGTAQPELRQVCSLAVHTSAVDKLYFLSYILLKQILLLL